MSSHVNVESLKIVHVTAPAQFGGLERVLSGLCPGLVEEGLTVSVVAVLEPSTREPSFLAQIREAGVHVEVMRIGGRDYAAERRAVLNFLRETGPCVVHTHGYRTDVIVGNAVRRAGYPVVTTLHGFTRQGMRDRLYEWLQLRTVRRFDAVVAVSDVLATELRTRGVPAEKLRVIRNGVVGDVRRLRSRAESRKELGLPSDVPVIGWVGRLSAEKDPQLAVAAFVAAAHPDAVLCVVGDGPLAGETAAIAARLGASGRVRMVGAVADASDLFRAFDVLLLSSSTEGTPMAIVEAAIAGVPVVATAVGGVPDLLGPDSAALAPHGNVVALGGALARVLADGGHAEALTAALRARVFAEPANAWIRKYAELYATLRVGDRMLAGAR